MNILASKLPPNSDRQANTIPTTTAVAIIYFKPFFARLYSFAPTFCAVNTAIDCKNAQGKIIVNTVILLSIEYPDAIAVHKVGSDPN